MLKDTIKTTSSTRTIFVETGITQAVFSAKICCLNWLLRVIGQNIRYSRVNCALGPSKSVRYSGDFVTVGFVRAGFVSTNFTVILPGFQILFFITGSSL